MSGPWEDYQGTESGPWSDYQAAPPAPATGPEFRQGKKPNLWQQITGIFRDPQKEAAKATEALVNARALNIRPSTAYEWRDSVDKVLEMKPEHKAKRDRYLGAIRKFNDTGIEDGWTETFWKSIQRVPLEMQIAAGGLLQEFEELTPLGMGGAPMQFGFGVPTQEVIQTIADNQQRKEALSMGKEWITSGKEKIQPIAANVEPGGLKDIVGKASDSAITNMVYLVPSLVTGNPAFALVGMGLQAKGQAYAEQREGGSSPLTASLASLGYGASEALTEFIPVGKYLKPGNSFVRRLVEAEFSEIPTEVVNTIVQDTIDKVTIRPEMTLKDALDDVYETIMVTAVSTLGLAGGSHTVNKVIGRTMPEGPAKQAFIEAKDAALDEDMTPQQAIAEGVKAAIQTEEGRTHAESIVTKVEQSARHQAEKIAAQPRPVIDTDQLDAELDAIFSGEKGIEDLIVDEIVMEEEAQEETPFPDVAENPEQTILDSLKAINSALGEKGSVDLAPLMELGKTVLNEGKTALEDFTARMKEHLGEAWETVKDLVQRVYGDLKRILTEERGSFSTEESSRSRTQDRGAKKRIREITGQTRQEGTVTESTAMSAAFKKAEQASKQAYREGVKEGARKANALKPETVKQRVKRVTGQVSIANMIREDEALRAAFKKAEQAGRIAFREGRKEGVEQAKREITEIMDRIRAKRAEREDLNRDVKAIRNLAEMKGDIAVDYQKQIKAITDTLDFSKPTEATLDRLQDLHDYLEREGVPLGINPKRVKELNRLAKTPIRDMTPADIKELRQQLEELTAIGKLKFNLKFKYKERERFKILNRIIKTTNNLDPDVNLKEERFGDKVKTAGISFYLDTLHAPRVADMADSFAGYQGEQARLTRMFGEAETQAVSKAMDRGLKFMEFLKAEGIEVIPEESATDVRMMIAMRYREGALAQAETLMDHYKLPEVPTLTATEEKIIEWIRQDMENHKADLAATWEEVVNEIFPEQKTYFLPLKYVKEEEIIPDAQTEGRGRTTHTFDGFSHKRRPGVKKLPRVGILQIYQEAVMEQEWYKSIQPVVEDIKSVVLTDEYKEAAGTVLYNWWKDQLDIMSRRGWSASAQLNAVSGLLRTVRHNINTAILAYKASTIIMQPFAVFDAAAYVNARIGTRAAARVLGEVTKSFLIPGRTQTIVEGSEALKQRQGGELAITEELKKAKGEGIKDRLTRTGFKWISATDLKTAAGVQEAVRKVFVEEGMTEAEALREAEFVMQMSQGSSSIAYRPHVLAKGEGARTWFTFQTFVLNRWGLIIHDIITSKIAKGTAREKLAGLVSLGIIMLAGASEDEAREWVYKLVSGKEMKADNRSTVEKTFVNLMSTMPFFGNIIDAASTGRDTYPPAMQVLVKGSKGMKQLLTGKDADKRLKGLLNALESGLAIGVGFPGTAQFFDLLERAMLKEKR